MLEKPIIENDEFVMDIDGEEQIKMNPSINQDKDKSLGEDKDASPRNASSS